MNISLVSKHPAEDAMYGVNVIPNIIPYEIQLIIFSYLEEPDLLICEKLCRVWKRLAKDKLFHKVPDGAFGKKSWEHYFGVNVGEEPLPPRNYKIKEGEILFLIPAVINGQPFNRILMGQLFAKALGDEKIICSGGYNCITSEKFEELPEEDGPYWAAMKDGVIEETRNKCYEIQASIIKEYDKDYTHPKLDQAIVGIFIAMLKSGVSQFGHKPLTYTRVKERVDGFYHMIDNGHQYDVCPKHHLVVGNFCKKGLNVCGLYDCDDNQVGAAPFRKFL